MPLPDGSYRYTLVVHDQTGRVLTSTTHVIEIATAGPQGSAPLVQTQDSGSQH
jgi:hypothetical protein